MVTKGMVWAVLAILYALIVIFADNTALTIGGAFVLAIVAVTMPVWGQYVDSKERR